MLSDSSVKSLDEFEISGLDLIERKQYEHYIKSMSKTDALMIIINSVEGDITQLSHGLAEIAEMMERRQPEVSF